MSEQLREVGSISGVGTEYVIYTNGSAGLDVYVMSGPASRYLGTYQTNVAALGEIGKRIDRELEENGGL